MAARTRSFPDGVLAVEVWKRTAEMAQHSGVGKVLGAGFFSAGGQHS
ncbi:MAG: hypothetical protein HYS33_09880 [Acidobacteria bacterium]|nr:hypothetical protein [Acidobacteriota bacterium]